MRWTVFDTFVLFLPLCLSLSLSVFLQTPIPCNGWSVICQGNWFLYWFLSMEWECILSNLTQPTSSLIDVELFFIAHSPLLFLLLFLFSTIHSLSLLLSCSLLSISNLLLSHLISFPPTLTISLPPPLLCHCLTSSSLFLVYLFTSRLHFSHFFLYWSPLWPSTLFL